jgi:hypothetical protein
MPVFAKIEYTHGKLSISGVIAPTPAGNAYCAGQINYNFDLGEVKEYAPGWSAPLLSMFLSTWERWHLNDLRPNEDGTGWTREEVPQDVIDWLQALPDADRTPAWV